MKIRLMTSNVWGDFFGNPVEPREPLLSAVFTKYAPDILGLQEAGPSWWKSALFPNLSKKWQPVPVETNGKINCVPLFYSADRFDLLYSSWHQFHAELDYSKGWTCGVFKDKTTHKAFAVFNTHFWGKEELQDEVIRRYNAMEMSVEMKRVGDFFQCPVFFMGDVNTVGSFAWNYLEKQGWKSSFYCTPNHSEYSSYNHVPVINPDGTCCGKATNEPKEKSIDHIGVPEGITVVQQDVVIDQEALNASDHSPVFADIEL